MWALLDAERRERGTTVLFSTHYLAEAEPADRVVLLARGRVVADDAPGALRAELGEEIAEIEGPGAERLARRYPRPRGAHGWSCGPGAASGSASRGSASRWWSWPAAAPGIERFALRPHDAGGRLLRPHPESRGADVPEPV